MTTATAATIPCEQCGQPFSKASATYSTTGQLVCPACNAKGMMADTSARADAGRRSARIMAIMTVALVVGMPALMIAAGAGQYVATGLMIMGAVLLVGARMAFRLGTRGAVWVMLAGVAVLVLGGVLQGALGHR
jgi:hypothetical protein